jgi:hypothetical protein
MVICVTPGHDRAMIPVWDGGSASFVRKPFIFWLTVLLINELIKTEIEGVVADEGQRLVQHNPEAKSK